MEHAIKAVRVYTRAGADAVRVESGGRLVTIAAAGERTTEPRVRDAFFIVEPNRVQLTEVAGLIDAGTLRPIVAAVFPLAEAAQAYAHKPLHGKVVLTIP